MMHLVHGRRRMLVVGSVLLGIFWYVAHSMTLAVPPAAERSTTLKQVKALVFQDLIPRIDRLEQNHPRDAVDLMKIRAGLQHLYQFAEGKNQALEEATARHDSRSRTTAGGARAPDPELGTDLYATCATARGKTLRVLLRGICGTQTPVGYQKAQDVIFSKVDNHDGEVECVYTGRRLRTSGEPSADNMNIEHTWPQSKGAVGEAKSDLHHLFPTDSKANSTRSSFPFGMVSGRPDWESGGSRRGGNIFEVRPPHRGNVARAMFYFSVRYGKTLDPAQEACLRQWHKQDPVDDAERARNDRVENLQHNRNPFIDHPEYVDSIADF